MRAWMSLAVLLWAVTGRGANATDDWPMLAHDVLRSGATTTELRPPFERKWYRLFADEGLMSGVQPVVVNGDVYVGSLRGILHALDTENGKDLWTFQAGGPLLHSVACGRGKVVFGCANGSIYALKTSDGSLAWEVQTGSAVWNAPAIYQNLAIVGSRDQRVFAIELDTGNIRWTTPTGGPLLGSPAIDPRAGRVYIGSEDMHVYAFDWKDGTNVWRSDKLPGVSLRGYHPVIAPDGSVLVTTAPGISVDTFQALLLDMAKSVFGDFASWRHSSEANAVLREENFVLMQKPETYTAQVEFIRKHLAEQPAYQTFFVLDPATGRQKFVAPVVYSESMNGPGAPAIVTPDNKVLVKFQALLRSRYEHYSPFLNVGELNTSTGAIRPVLDESRTYGWYDGLLLVHDEQCQLAVGGNVLFNTHQDNVNGLDLQTLDGFPTPFCRNVHEPKPGEALALWAMILRNQELPVGKEWLARGTAVYGGGSVLDTSVSIAGDSFYYVPTHELNAGVAVIAYRMNAAAATNQESQLPPTTLTPEEWQKVQKLPWDWDTLEARRLNHVLDALPGKIPGTRSLPLTNDALKIVSALVDSDLDEIIWEAQSKAARPKPGLYVTGLKSDLAEGIKELISDTWRPLVFPSGKFPEEAYRFFTEPTETLYTLGRAYPHLNASLQEQVRATISRWSGSVGPLAGPVGDRTYAPSEGVVRSEYDPPPEKLLKFQADILRSDLARLYPWWLWAYVSGDWSKLEKEWPKLGSLVEQRPNPMEEDCRNGYLAGLIAYCRLADHMKDATALAEGLPLTRKAIRERLSFELSHTQGGLIWPVSKLRSIFSRWRFLTPEVGRMLHERAGGIEAGLMDRYVEYHRPAWWLAWNVETMMRNESPYEFPTMSMEVFSARSMVLQEAPEKLALFVDRPWCHADLYYLQKLALTLDAAQPGAWVDIRASVSP